ncbi:hypothetical protein TWF569_011340 [Orbilia oligospora]|uniref:Uncharacterized protein n=1 Tax=Orbilia oligospora TaxID=2813651 RepID=A0A7C8NP39_ORBOL|nr:hypothetical protein TWF706_002745 [Orbilia oligospora]KAF3098135.1 hypothetical protein TWF102_006126 [Orbilia oligospora]KAF3151393.1 hypothetical protein TWF594_007041 [Orbilia oligospora]KAF3154685.1 hypothetical protein TWF569_011340 [Orbilia oligospora]
MESNHQILQGRPSVRPRSHSDPSSGRSGQPPAFSSSETSTQIVQLDPVATKSNYMRAMAEMDSITGGLEVSVQAEAGPIDEISKLMQNCSITNNQPPKLFNHTFLEHFKIPINDWSLGLVTTARQTGDYSQLARIVAVLEHFSSTPGTP